MLQLHRDRKQALRAQRVLLGLVAYLMWIAVGIYLYWIDLLHIGPAGLGIYFLLMLLTNAAFLAAVRWNWNLRFRDPGMTLGQIACGIFWGMVLLSQAAPEARGGMLLVFVTGFFFGVFRLNTQQFLGLALFASLAYASLIRAEWADLDAETRQIELAQWVFLSLILLWMSFMGGYVARLRSNLRQAMGRIEELANRDHLTGTRNRRAITGSLEEAVARAETEGEVLTIAMLDLDHFKAHNDDHGHLLGDELLKQFVERVERELRADDIIRGQQDQPLGRFGGEEFLVVLPGTGLDGGMLAAERIRRGIAELPFETEAGAVAMTVSIGLTEWRPGDDCESLLKRADKALYEAKEGGRNQVVAAE
ncbi:diguanylate cyclase [Gammaproteobacteria bacterium AB-CW1]|uniref:diguanylate cyclase n=1 Tax=Natronospira elongata TaxID=3110268 RepID=A0AAP6JEC3_9GAMM|nr:diguanylate cyclase [Gammaproteobacteria bacterium AB-CW1]